MYTHIYHTHTHIYIYIYAHTYTRTYIHTYTYRPSLCMEQVDSTMSLCGCVEYMHTCIHTYIYTRITLLTATTYIYSSCTHICIYYINTWIHIPYIRIHIHTYTYSTYPACVWSKSILTGRCGYVTYSITSLMMSMLSYCKSTT